MQLFFTKFFFSLQSLQAVDSSGDEGTLEQLTALRNHLIALGKSDGQLQALRDKTADLPPSKQDISVMEIRQVWPLQCYFPAVF